VNQQVWGLTGLLTIVQAESDILRVKLANEKAAALMK
jgi:hypothetical protein